MPVAELRVLSVYSTHLNWPGPAAVFKETMQRRVVLLILPLRLTVGLGVKTRGQADNGPKQSAEFSPEDEGELGSTVRDDINWNPVQAENMLDLAEGRLDNGMKLAILLIGRPLSVWQCGPQMGIVRSPEGCGTMRDDEAPGEAAGDQPEPGCLFAHWAGIDKFPGVFVQ